MYLNFAPWCFHHPAPATQPHLSSVDTESTSLLPRLNFWDCWQTLCSFTCSCVTHLYCGCHIAFSLCFCPHISTWPDFLHIYMHTHIYICIYIHIYAHTHIWSLLARQSYTQRRNREILHLVVHSPNCLNVLELSPSEVRTLFQLSHVNVGAQRLCPTSAAFPDREEGAKS